LCNLAFENLFGFTRAELVGDKLATLLPDPQAGDPLELSPQLYNGKSVHGNTQRVSRDGSLIHVEIRAVPLVIDGQVCGSYALYEDISGDVKAAHEKAEQQNLLQGVVSELQSRTNEMTLLIDLSGLLQCCAGLDEAYTIITQFGARLFSERSSGSLSVFKSSRNVLEMAASWGTATNAPPTFVPDSCWALRRGKPHWSRNAPDGLVCPHLKNHLGPEHALCVPMVAQGDTIGVLQLHLAAAPESHSSDKNYETALERIASSAAGQIALSIASLRLRAALKDQSIRDPLTGLYNRRFMQEYLERELPRARRANRSLAVVFIDLDHFKRFNDSFGHEAGDSVLQVFAKALTTHFRDSDVICRYGGEEFALVLPDSPLAQAELRVSGLREEVKKMIFTHRDTKLGSVTLSAGIAAFPTNGHTAEELFRVADHCLYESKRQGRDRVTLPSQDAAMELTTVSNLKSSN
jgi:diguanylate cyclase (GGDEF)-like protein/PAS domain S-box-containing protein